MGHGRQRCPNGRKRRYPDHEAAVRALHIFELRDSARVPVRSYFCEACNGYHLTSQEKRQPSRRAAAPPDA